MQPHVNMGINFRKQFEKIGFSSKRLMEIHRRVRRKLRLHFLNRGISYNVYKEYIKVLTKMKKNRFIDESYFSVNVTKKQHDPWWRW
jgi:hypothetical protein